MRGYYSVMNRHFVRALASVMRYAPADRIAPLAALRTFRRTVASVPAYRDLLSRLCVPVERIVTSRDFHERVPVVDQATYVCQYPPELLCRGGTFLEAYSIERCAGPVGATIRIRGREETERFTASVERLLGDVVRADQHRTLAVVAWSATSWPGGERFAHAVQALAESRRLQVATMTPGADTDACLDAVREMRGQFDQVLLAATPMLLRAVVEQGRQTGVDWRGRHVHLLGAGRQVSETWREAVRVGLGQPAANRRTGAQILSWPDLPEHDVPIGVETPMAVLVRRLAAEDVALCRDLFDGLERVPDVLQFNPLNLYAERIDGKLVLTTGGTVPLVRFTHHDNGGAITFHRARDILNDHGYDIAAMLSKLGWRPHTVAPFPLLYCVPRIMDGPVRGVTAGRHALSTSTEASSIGASTIGASTIGASSLESSSTFMTSIESAIGSASSRT
jgi:hypothetical protein